MLYSCAAGRQTLVKIRNAIDVLQSLKTADRAEQAVAIMENVDRAIFEFMEFKKSNLDMALRDVVLHWSQTDFDGLKKTKEAFEKYTHGTIGYTSSAHKTPNGSVAGYFVLNGEWCLFNGTRIMTAISGKKFTGINMAHVLPSSRLTGLALVDNEWYPFIDDHLLNSVEGKKVVRFEDIKVIGDTIEGRLRLENTRWILFVWDGRHEAWLTS